MFGSLFHQNKPLKVTTHCFRWYTNKDDLKVSKIFCLINCAWDSRICPTLLPQAFLRKSPDSQKNPLDLKKITTFKISALKFNVLLDIIYLCTLSPKNLYTFFGNFLKIDHVEVWKILYQRSSCFFHELKSTTLAEYFWSNNLTFYQYISTAVTEMKVAGTATAINRSENKKKLSFKKLLVLVLLVQIFSQRFT